MRASTAIRNAVRRATNARTHAPSACQWPTCYVRGCTREITATSAWRAANTPCSRQTRQRVSLAMRSRARARVRTASRPRCCSHRHISYSRSGLANAHNFERGDAANPSRMALVTGNYKAQRTFVTVERLAVATVRQDNYAVAEIGIELGQRKEHRVTVRSARDDADRHVRSFQIFAEWRARLLEDLGYRYAGILDRGAFFIGNANRLPLKCRDVGGAEIEMRRHVANDAQRSDWRCLRKSIRRRA